MEKRTEHGVTEPMIDEPRRLRELDLLEILDTPPELAFDALTAVAASLFDVPIALVTFVDADRQWFKSAHGLSVTETPRAIAFCSHTIESSGLFVVPDAFKDPVFADNPLVLGDPNIRFYAGAPLELPSGMRVGSLAILDRVPRTLDAREREQLVRLSRVVVDAVVQRLDRQRAEKQSRRHTAILRAALDGIVMTDAHGLVVEMNPAAERIFGHSRASSIGKDVGDLIVPDSLRARHRAGWAHHLATGESKMLGRRLELPAKRADGTEFPIELTVVRLPESPPVFAAFIHDLTERRALEAQLLQSQKMDAVGQLAGGIAHDFNNLLSVILSYAELIMPELGENDPLAEDIAEIRKAALRAADLTRRLLTFSRQQVLDPTFLDLNEVVKGMTTMLQRVLGADIDLALALEAPTSRSTVHADLGSVEQVILNLVINARDAMPTGGKLTLETAHVIVEDDGDVRRAGVAPGRYVMLAVTDTGCGMAPETRARLFEPFYTTKEKGKGTGLGLSTVFGIVKQSGGAIVLHSEPGKGARFEIYLPARDVVAKASLPAPAAATLRGSETILLVEDEDAVRKVVGDTLRKHGYTVLSARSPGEAILLFEQAGKVDLLLTDVVMPQMSGPDLAKRLLALWPDLRVLCMSGYMDDSAVRHGVSAGRLAFLQKPFAPDRLTRKVREVLDAPLRAAAFEL